MLLRRVNKVHSGVTCVANCVSSKKEKEERTQKNQGGGNHLLQSIPCVAGRRRDEQTRSSRPGREFSAAGASWQLKVQLTHCQAQRPFGCHRGAPALRRLTGDVGVRVAEPRHGSATWRRPRCCEVPRVARESEVDSTGRTACEQRGIPGRAMEPGSDSVAVK